MQDKLKVGFIFPGQGSQYVGMGKYFVDNYKIAEGIINQANDILGFNLKSYIFDGDEEGLRNTAITQPAVFTTSVAILKVFMEEYYINDPFFEIAAVAGHSLGEYSGLFAANVFDFTTALGLVNKRAKFIQEASKENPGNMAAILGLNSDKVKEICAKVTEDEKLIVGPVNFNSSQQIVIAGHTAACEKAIVLAKEQGAKRAILLNVSGPFHSSLMYSAREKFAKEIEKITLNDAKIPVAMNYNAKLSCSSGEIKTGLIEQIDSPVLWEESILNMINYGVKAFIEIGPGKVLSNLLKRIDKNMQVFNIEDKLSLEKTIESLKSGH